MAEETLSKDDIIEIVNDAYNERKEELLETVRQENEQKFNELNERLGAIEEQLKEPDKEPDKDPDKEPGKEPDKEPDKAFKDALEKAIQEKTAELEKQYDNKLKEFLQGLQKKVNPKYDSNKHIQDPDKEGKEDKKSYTKEEIAKMLSR